MDLKVPLNSLQVFQVNSIYENIIFFDCNKSTPQ